MVEKRKGMMFVLSSPSGAGKTTLTKKLAENNHNFKISVSHTTRKPRPSEIDGKDYHFISKEKFDLLVKNNKFFEHAVIFNHQYGTLKEPVIEYMTNGKDVLFDIDWQGTQQLKVNKHITITGKLDKMDWINLSLKYDIFINTTNYDNHAVSI